MVSNFAVHLNTQIKFHAPNMHNISIPAFLQALEKY